MSTKTLSALSRDLDGPAWQTRFASLYRSDSGGPSGAAARYRSLLDTFAGRFGETAAARFFSTPGRTEIGGNHTDHQHGCVLAGSVSMDVVALAAPNGLDVIRLESEGYPGQEIPLDDLQPNPEEFNDSRALVRGIAARFRQLGYSVGGFDACLTSTVLKGSGLSSSAAFEVMIGTIVNHLFAGGAVSPVETAIIGRYAENVFFGKPCGLMDQLACSVGGVLYIDFATIDNPAITRVEYDFLARGYALCIIDSGADHACLTDEYSPIPAEMGRVAAHFGKRHLREVERDAFLRELPAIRREAGDRAVLRALHFFDDNGRVALETRALQEDRIEDFLRLVNESGTSSWQYLQNIAPCGSTREQAVAVTLAMTREFLEGRGACRVHGGGFAGTVQAFVPVAMLEEFTARIEAAMGAGCCHVLAIRNEGSIGLGD